MFNLDLFLDGRAAAPGKRRAIIGPQATQKQGFGGSDAGGFRAHGERTPPAEQDSTFPFRPKRGHQARIGGQRGLAARRGGARGAESRSKTAGAPDKAGNGVTNGPASGAPARPAPTI